MIKRVNVLCCAEIASWLEGKNDCEESESNTLLETKQLPFAAVLCTISKLPSRV